jgi:hypothetical protein
MSSADTRARRLEAAHVENLRAELRYLSQRRDLYRARLYGGRSSSPERLAELDRQHALALSRLRRAEREAAPPS